jgi:hypothetical protein
MEAIVKRFTTMKNLKFCFLPLVAILTFLSCEKDVKEMTIRITSRMYPNYHEEHKVKMYQKFPIADTELEGVVVEFYPDFSIDTLTFKAISISDTLRNPAVKILIIKGRDKKEEAWAFSPGLIPHFSPKSFMGFELMDIKTTSKYKRPLKDKVETGKKND